MRTRRSQEQWAAVVEELAASGERIDAFCRRQGIRRTTLSWWKWKLARSPRRPSPDAAIRWLPVSVSPPHGGSTGAAAVAIDVVDVRVHVEVGTDVTYVAALVESLRRRC